MTTNMLAAKCLVPVAEQRELRGLNDEYAVYEIP